jgi:integrase
LPSSLPHLEKRRQVWFARLRVPADCVDAIGKRVLIQTTGETDQSQAALRAAPIIKRWKQQIEAARLGTKTALDTQVEALAAQYRRVRDTELADGVLEDAIQFVVERLAGKSVTALDAAYAESADLHTAVREVAGPKAAQALDIVTGSATPWLSHLDDWKASCGLEGRTLSMFVSDVTQAGFETVEGLVGTEKAQEWVNNQTASKGTIERKLAALRNYWKWLQSRGVVPKQAQPFTGLILPRANKDAVQRRAFTPEEVSRLTHGATGTLLDLITLAAYTGARIEELCGLQVKDVDQKLQTVSIRDSKTQKGLRTIPIHGTIVSLVDRLIRDSRDGYLIPSTSSNQYGERSVALGKQFQKLRTRLGFGPEHVFHSIRKTVASLLHDAGCREPIAADILGHEISTMSYGVYSACSTIQTRREWLERAIRYP